MKQSLSLHNHFHGAQPASLQNLNYCQYYSRIMLQPLKKFIAAEESEFATIFKHADFLRALNIKIAKHLRPELISHCCVSSLREEKLRIAVDSAALSLQLQFDIPSLLEQFSFDETLPKITSVECYVDSGWKNIISPVKPS